MTEVSSLTPCQASIVRRPSPPLMQTYLNTLQIISQLLYFHPSYYALGSRIIGMHSDVVYKSIKFTISAFCDGALVGTYCYILQVKRYPELKDFIKLPRNVLWEADPEVFHEESARRTWSLTATALATDFHGIEPACYLKIRHMSRISGSRI
ncbi:hypothetical protein BC835DRAFT_1368594 [Cytidiella melzeri]|nr:hypothetical protein BC835DRAFT_1368594 [Cytidiella melzeri]